MLNPDLPSGRCSMTGHNVARPGGMQHKTARPAARDLQGGRSPPGRHAESRGCARPPGPADWSRRPPGHPSDDGRLTNNTLGPAGWLEGADRRLAGAVTDVAQRSSPSRRDTPSPGWESGVWTRIQRRRRHRRLGTVLLGLAAAAGGALVAHHRVLEAPAPLSVQVELRTPLRADGSAPLHARLRATYEGAELRVYRNALAAALRCPGDSECTATRGGGVADVQVEAPGEYRAVVLSRRLPGAGTTMQEDLALARARGDRVEVSASLVVY